MYYIVQYRILKKLPIRNKRYLIRLTELKNISKQSALYCHQTDLKFMIVKFKLHYDLNDTFKVSFLILIVFNVEM